MQCNLVLYFRYLLLVLCGVTVTTALGAPPSSSGNTSIVAGQSKVLDRPHIKVSLVSEYTRISPGQPFWVALRLVPEEGWHTYWRNPGDTGLPTRIHWSLPNNSQAGEILWPIPERIDYQGLINYGFHGETLLLTQITPNRQFDPNQLFEIKALAKWLVCADICIPDEANLSLTLPTGTTPEISPWAERLGEALNSLPRKIKTDSSSFRLGEGFEFDIRFRTGQLEDSSSYGFFPLEAELMKNAVGPRINRDGNRLTVKVAKDEYLAQAPSDFGFLITFVQEGKREAYELLASGVSAPIGGSSTLPGDSVRGYGFISILFFALLGGLILNLMPCVFPVLSIKVLSLMESGNHSRGQQRLQGLAYTAGVVLSFVLIAGLLLAIRAAGQGVGWGFQLQSPWFVAALAYLFFVLGLGMAGFVEIGAFLTRAGNLLGNQHGLLGSFSTGVLATVVATPCTAPFMGTAMGYALTQSTGTALLVFATLGLGLALPFLLITHVPSLANSLPKPGAWMATVKEFLAFPLFITVVWLLWVLSNQTNTNVLALVLTGIVLIAFSLWLLRTSAMQDSAPVKRSFAVLALVAALTLLLEVGDPDLTKQGGIAQVTSTNAELNALPYSDQLLIAEIEGGRPVFVNFTADWCITCKVNERIAFKDDDLIAAFAAQNVSYLVGDWTRGDEQITRILERFGRSGVPLYLLYLPGQADPQILPQILTADSVIDALQKS